MFKVITFSALFLCLTGLTYAESGPGLKLTTYNAGLANTFVKYSKNRVPKVSEGLAKLDSDVICLQEVWAKKDRNKITKDLKKQYPHSFFMKIKQTRSKKVPTCQVKELFGEEKFVQCMRDNCSGLSGDDFTSCIIKDCGKALENLKNSNRECAQGLMAQVGKGTIKSLLTVLNPFYPAGQFTYKGSTGLLLLSKIPFTKKSVLDFSAISSLTRRAVLQVEVEKNNQNHKISCTHLTANLDGTAPYAGTFANWEEENLAQVDLLLEQEKNNESATYLLGDFNCSIKDDSADVEADFEKSCHKFTDAGFSDPVAEQNPGCTYCRDNNLVNEGNDPKGFDNLLLDHIFSKNNEALDARVTMKEKVDIEVKGGKVIKTHLSDHFGTSVEYKD